MGWIAVAGIDSGHLIVDSAGVDLNAGFGPDGFLERQIADLHSGKQLIAQLLSES